MIGFIAALITPDFAVAVAGLPPDSLRRVSYVGVAAQLPENLTQFVAIGYGAS